MSKIFYTASENTFYPESDFTLYAALPDDLKEVTMKTFNEFSPFTNGDLIRVAGEDGLPKWGERPPMTPYDAEIRKSGLMTRATTEISPLQDAVDLDMATTEEKALLLSWKKYRVLLMRIDTSIAPDINWPEQP